MKTRLNLRQVDDYLKVLNPTEQEAARQILQEYRETGYSTTLDQLWEQDYCTRPPTIQEFLDEKYYLGYTKSNLYDVWREALLEVFAPDSGVSEVNLTGAIGTGKTTVALIGLSYQLCALMHMRSIHQLYNLIEGDPIVVALFNITKELAESVDYKKLKGVLDLSPYFRENCKRNRVDTYLTFPNNIGIALGAEAVNSLGASVFCGMMDETSFSRYGFFSEASKRTFNTYTSILRRNESRFPMLRGRFRGVFFLVSSKKDESDFTESHIQSVQGLSHVRVYDYALYDVKSRQTHYSGKKFKVLVGNSNMAGKVLLDDERAPEGATVIEIPIEHRDAYVLDVDSALRDISGITGATLGKLIRNREKILACVDQSIVDPFVAPWIQMPISTTPEDTIDKYLKPNTLLFQRRLIDSVYVPRRAPEATRYAHVDLGLTGDSAGIAMVHQEGVKEVTRVSQENVIYKESVPLLIVDFVLEIKPTPGSQIDLAKIGAFFLYLRAAGFRFGAITYDGYQSAESVQRLLKSRFKSGVLSLDKNDIPYLTLRAAVVEERVHYYQHPRLISELTQLRHDERRKKVNHPIRMPGGEVGSKDVSDALCGAVYNALQSESKEDRGFRTLALLEEIPKMFPSEDEDEMNWLIGSD
jgi:hypothetical protein